MLMHNPIAKQIFFGEYRNRDCERIRIPEKRTMGYERSSAMRSSSASGLIAME
jgi:hypothetical protein